jgi:hypothetical protein
MKRLVAVEQPVPAGQQVALQPALAQVLGQHLHHPAVAAQMVIAGSSSASQARSVFSNTG